jgi:hypothetical protein
MNRKFKRRVALPKPKPMLRRVPNKPDLITKRREKVEARDVLTRIVATHARR